MLHYTYQEQRGQPIILYLHGFLGGGDDWSETSALLGNDFSHLMVDLPGHGKSIGLNDDVYTMPGCAKSVAATLRQLDIRQCRLVGYSMGGRLGLYLATHYPELFNAVIIESGSPGLKRTSEREERVRRDLSLAAALESEPLSKFLDFWYTQPLFQTLDHSSDRVAVMTAGRLKADPTELARSLVGMGTGAQDSLWEKLPALQPPICFIAGESDTKFHRLAAEMAHLCPAGELAILASAGHIVHFEQPTLFADQVRRFFSGKS